MEKKRVLFVTQEMKPYLALTDISDIARKLPQYVYENGMDIRVLMPRFGDINERRNRLHEVVRLSGINIVVDEEDHPLIIKVASLPGARIQVYFLDNEDFFKRKGAFGESDEEFFEDNEDRMIFFCKGVLETVKKFGWPPDLIHCHGWMTSLIPLLLKTSYDKDPIFAKSKVVYSVYENSFKQSMKNIVGKMQLGTDLNGTADLFNTASNNSLQIGGAKFADAVIKGSEELDGDLLKALKGIKGLPVLDFKEEGEYLEAYLEFYKMLLEV